MRLKLFKREESIIGKIEAYLEQIDKCRDRFIAAFGALIVDPSDVSRGPVADVHAAEAKADDLRRSIELTLYEKALIPESRGDVLGLIETVDRIPNSFEHIVADMHVQQLAVPKKFRERFLNLVEVNVDAYNAMRDSVRDFFYNRKNTVERLSHIDERESKSDQLQRKLIKNIFAADMDTGEKILLRDLVNQIGEISDGAEQCADRLILAVVKRRP